MGDLALPIAFMPAPTMAQSYLRRKQNGDVIAFGRPFITNPDLPQRFKNDWPLNPAEDMSLWYTPGAEGYTDYEPFQPPASV
jgi:2,4-dienoyl-CoA reductase-like NADH-dependent reductase (Old Yellow Enzyme family)